MTERTIANSVQANNGAASFAEPNGGFEFRPATKAKAKARIALTGPSGSGKTMTALITATNLGDSVAVIDTERGSASKYSGAKGFAFDTLEMYRHDPSDLPKALAAAAASGHDVVVVDSLSHFWFGTGGMLEQVDAAAKRSYSGNTFAGWKDAAPIERAMIDALVSYPGHVIVTMRVKTEWVIEGRTPRKVGLKPEQRHGIEYEFDIVGDLDEQNTLIVSKSRCPDLTGAVIRKPDGAFAQTILGWLDDGAEAITVSQLHDSALAEDATLDSLRELHTKTVRLGLAGAAILDPDGNPTTLGALIKARGTLLRADSGA
jgi:AAA domain